ncbi:uncharacterized protein N7500_006597, partial [Penicillium coprophilum]|uniref:uncharacterized protein n=1 Tax=Penicillium coprophilum TaxID=36646 RepID=UPI0023A55A4A
SSNAITGVSCLFSRRNSASPAKRVFCGSEPLPHSALNNSEILSQINNDLKPRGCPWALPKGSLEALVGFMLEDTLDAQSGYPRNTKISIPCQFQDSGWNVMNSLTRAANPIQRDFTTVARCCRPTQESETESFIRFNQSIIQPSGLQVILMCGRTVKDLVLPTEREGARLKLRSGEFPMFLDIENEAIKRPVDAFLLQEWRKTHRISEVLHFASATTMTVGIRPYAGHNGCALTKAIRDHTDERKGIKEHLTLETIHPMTRLWLTRRGFAIDEDISLLQEKEGGSLSNAILVLMHVTPRHFQNATTISSMNSFHRSGKRHDPEFNVDGAQLEAVRDPWAQLNEKLPVDCDHPRNDVIQNVRSREKELEYNVWEANIREDLETSRIFLDDDGILIFAALRGQEKKPRACAADRSFTVGEKSRQELLQGRKYLGTRTKRQVMFVEVILKAEIRPPSQRHLHVWVQETLPIDPESRLTFCVMYTTDTMETSSSVTSNLVKDLYKANSFIH